MNEYLNRFQDVAISIDEILMLEESSLELKQSATQLHQSINPCIQEVKKYANNLRNLLQECFNNLSDAEDVWHSKQRITDIATSDLWEELGALSVNVFKLRRLKNQYKLETLEKTKINWHKKVTKLEQYFLLENKNHKNALNIFEKDGFVKHLRFEIETQIEEIKISLMYSTALIINQIVEPRIAFFQKCIDQLDQKEKYQVVSIFNSVNESIKKLVETAFIFKERGAIIYYNIKYLIDSVIQTSDFLSKQSGLTITRNQFTKCYEEVIEKLEKVIDAVIDELFKLTTQGMEQAIAFYNDFLERQLRYQQETPEQRLAEKVWIYQQRLEIARVQNGIDAILNNDYPQ